MADKATPTLTRPYDPKVFPAETVPRGFSGRGLTMAFR